MVASDSCRNGLCSTNFTLSADQNYIITVGAGNAFGQSDPFISGIKSNSLPTITKLGLLGAGVSVLIINLLFYIPLIICTAVQSHSKCNYACMNISPQKLNAEVLNTLRVHYAAPPNYCCKEDLFSIEFWSYVSVALSMGVFSMIQLSLILWVTSIILWAIVGTLQNSKSEYSQVFITLYYILQ